MLGGVRPTAARRSWWLREALAAEAAAAPHLAAAAPPLRGTTTADVVIVGGGYTGLWTALRLTELEPSARVVLIESDICGGGPSGRNGGFVTNWWDELPTLIDRYGVPGAIGVGEAMEAAVDEVGAFCATNGVDAWFTKAGSLSASAAPAQDGGWMPAVTALREHGLGDRLVPLTAEEVQARVRSPVFREGAFMPGAATVQPATLARGLRRVLLERGVTIHEGTTATEIDGQRPGWLGALGAGTRRAPRRRGAAGGPRPVRVRTTSAAGDGEVAGGLGGPGAQRLGGGLAVVRAAPGHLVVVHRPDRAHPRSPCRYRLDRWRGRRRRQVHAPLPADDTGWADRDRRRWRSGRVRRSDRAGVHEIRPPMPGEPPRDCVACSRRFVTSASRTPGAARSISARITCPGSGRSAVARSTTATGTAATVSDRAVVGGRILAARAVERADDPALALALADGRSPRPFPPEPASYLGARLIREAAVRREIDGRAW